MAGRRHATKISIVLWTLIVLADLAVLLAAVGVLTLVLAVAGAVLIAATVVGLRWLGHRPRAAALPKEGMSTAAVPSQAGAPADEMPAASASPVGKVPSLGRAGRFRRRA